MNEYNLLKKNELKFSPIQLQNVDLNVVAATVAGVMALEPAEVLVTDVLSDVMTLDILRDTIYPHQVLAKKDLLLQALGALPGVTITAATQVTSEGMLGWIAADADMAAEAIRNAEAMTASIKARLAKRAIIFSTGAEVAKGEIKDTNSITITEQLKAADYTVKFGGVITDDQELIAGRIRRAINDGYTTVITTGGVGAESKDCTVEATESLDSSAAVPFICTFTKGIGRHVKEGVRIGVGEVDDAIIINLPGPNDEVRLSMPLVMDGLEKRVGKHQLAEMVAENLRETLRKKMQRHGHHTAHDSSHHHA